MLGSPTLTIVVSNTAMNEPASTTARIRQLRAPGCLSVLPIVGRFPPAGI
jgi:hypothetical protein